ncbi:DNA-3-methyladenine glycosylase [Geomonas sp. Red875]|uniref:Putative 3-methyladenine DNA glycosylase n=1 Tax=Geomesophilobacter sediminis TaxID=2798584 RepID=A0A8J7JDT1_9BACT|nr:DNA-3-methyladenine glycosylase [Geomesophilobacter sediminis]
MELPPKLPRSFYDRETILVARELLGCLLVRVDAGLPRVGKIVEVEAYLGIEDRAAHASHGLTPRTRVLYGAPGHAYVYLIYGMHWCLNVVTEPEGKGCAVLIRALEPLANTDGKTSGPGLVCRALHIDKAFHGHDLESSDLFLTEPVEPVDPAAIVIRPRIGVDYAGAWAEKPLRFYLPGNRFVSRK